MTYMIIVSKIDHVRHHKAFVAGTFHVALIELAFVAFCALAPGVSVAVVGVLGS